MSEKKDFEYIIINGVKIPILGKINTETDTVDFVDGAEEYIENLKDNKEEEK